VLSDDAETGSVVNMNPDEFRLMRNYVEQECGLVLTDDKTYLFEARLTPLMAERGFRDFVSLYRAATTDSSHAIRDSIIDAITTRETLWFRDGGPFVILDDMLRAHPFDRPLRIWSAACATGQEPYSIAITVREHFEAGHKPLHRQVDIHASDISTGALFLAKAGRYDQLAINRGLSSNRRHRYFIANGRAWTLSEDIRSMVRFFRQNLLDTFDGLGTFDIVFCRNVLMYFGEQFRRDVLRRLRGVMRRSGALFLGAAESPLHHSSDFELVHTNRSIYYRAT
jgi:chemotaxis protein methyltransferase CheR